MKISKPIGLSTSNEKKTNKQKKKGVIVDPLQVMDTKSVNFLSYFLNSEFQSK